MKSITALLLISFAQLTVLGQGLDISGWKVVQNDPQTVSLTLTIPQGTIVDPGGYVLIARNSSRASFESAWGVSLAPNVVFINGTSIVGGNGFPVINGSENFALQNASSVNQDGPTVSMPSPSGIISFKRKSANDPAGNSTSWTQNSTANPGFGMTNTNTGKVVISEFADNAASGQFNYEFVELFYDVTPAPKGEGVATILPSRWKYNSTTTLQLTFKPQTDTLRGFRFTRPAPLNWSPGNILVTPNATVTSSGNTTTITGISLAGTDSIVVTIPNVTAADTTDEFTFDIKSSTDGTTFLSLQAQLKTLVYGTPRPMNVVKRKNPNGTHTLLGKWAVVRGIVTVGSEFAAAPSFGGPAYLQDSTAGIAVFDSSVTLNVEHGDEVVLLGLVAPFNELFELTPCILLEKLNEANPVDTLVLMATQILSQTVSEPYEARLIRINNVTVNTTTWTVSGSGTNYNLTDATGTVQTRISPRVNFVGFPTPPGQFDMVGVLGQFFQNYQVLPRSLDDIIVKGAGPRIISSTPYEKTVSATSITFRWTTDAPGTSIVYYGPTSSYGSQVLDTNKVTDHEITISGLNSAAVYHVQLGSGSTSGTTYTSNYVASTASLSSSGQINVYLNKSINATVAVAETAMSNVNFVSKLVQRIDAAQYSIDVCMYNMSGPPGATVANALIRAKDRGVKVRVIGEKDTQGNAPWNTMKTAGITVIDDGFDAINAGAGLMHNKFIVIDYRDTTDANDWVWTGSWNITQPGTDNDMQNVIEIQDKALAGAFTLEFQEMWGSNTETPSAANSRFGARKLDNTPHYFIIAGTSVELYFSPSDRTTSQIIKTVNKSLSSVNVAMLTLTRIDIATALKTRRDAGVKVRGILDNSTDQGSQYSFFINNGMDFLIDVNLAYLHHKYAIVDADKKTYANYVITGSHNWSSSAENSNDENTLIIQSNRIANLYLQEFKARYVESGGQDNIIVSVERIDAGIPAAFGLSQNYPNPFNPTTNFELRIPARPAGGPNFEFVSLKVYDVLGREVAILVNEQKTAGIYTVTWNASHLASGVYYYRLTAGSFVETRKMLLVR